MNAALRKVERSVYSQKQLVNLNVFKERMRLKKRNRAMAVRRLVNPLCDQRLTSVSCRGAVCILEYQSICLSVGPSHTITVSSVCVCVCVCSQHPSSSPFFPDFPSVKNCGCVLTCSSLYPLLNLLFMLPSPNLMGLSVCLSVSASHPYQGSTKMTF